ncbi:unnamed protein product [Rhizophagus irregularis]|nr:unnamed protein product [Rhizophagus irregularis]
MANQDQIKRIVENAIGLTPNALDNALGVGQTLADRIQNCRNGRNSRNATFSGKEDEDVNDWIRQFDTALQGIALQWYNEEKERIAANLVNWCEHDDDRNLKRKLINRFTREDVKRRKMIELTGI